MAKKKSKKKKQKVVIKFEPSPHFEEEFTNFVGEVISCPKNKKSKI